MQEGGERMLTVPPALAYGGKKMPNIPPNSTLQFGTCWFDSGSRHAHRRVFYRGQTVIHQVDSCGSSLGVTISHKKRYRLEVFTAISSSSCRSSSCKSSGVVFNIFLL